MIWGGHLTGQQRLRINAFLKRARKFEFTESIYCIEELLEKSDTKLFGQLTNPRSRRSEHALPILTELHWLPIKHRIQYKIAVTVF